MNRLEISPRLLVAVQALLDRHGIASPREITPLFGSGRSRLYRVRSSEGRLLLKQSAPSAEQPGDRLAAEYKFCQFLHRAGLRQAAEPIAWDEGEGLALYEHIDGRPLRRAEIGEPEIEAALDFVHEINMQRHGPDARELALADEAAFSISEHIRGVDRRVRLLHEIKPTNPSQHATRRFARDELAATWKRTAESIESECVRIGIDLDASLAPDRRVLSPGDLGFHNALRTRDGRIRFLDLESAGWDDPAQLIADFSDHPAFPISVTTFAAFRARVFSDFSSCEFELRRSEILSPLFRTRRCCRVLEDFVADSQLEKSLHGARSDILASVNPLAAARLILNRTAPQPPTHPALGRQ
ncbi:MAG: aminoglycoside phosphotransferase family protein [Deltaproteobacteria bacterium]|nr:aminoglycoside phosphotransferase family protein [Deltaproteobacteria bacterium]MBW2724194.1 aminoglycoside phosphotransferase family protein [Deltaproteobacteria bacterium]